MTTPHSPQELLAILRWYQTSGVDIAVTEDAQDRFAEAQASRKTPVRPQARSNAASPNPAPAQKSAAPIVPEPADIEAAAATAAACKTMEELRAAYAGYDGCALKPRATQIVFSDGNPEADIMLIGEAPGQDEDMQGKPFVGRAGQLLDRMLAAIGLDREKVFIVNTVAWHPPGNRNPSPLEIASCRPFLDRQVQLAAPKLIMSLGLVATQTLFAEKISITRTRGQWRDVAFGDYTVPVLPTLHPAFLLRQPRQKREAWQDLLTLRAAVSELDAGKSG